MGSTRTLPPTRLPAAAQLSRRPALTLDRFLPLLSALWGIATTLSGAAVAAEMLCELETTCRLAQKKPVACKVFARKGQESTHSIHRI